MNFVKLSNYKTSKNEYGLCTYNGIVSFYKIKDDIRGEVEGYELIKALYNVPKLLYFDDEMIVYEFDEKLINKTLHEYIYYGCDIDLERVIQDYKSSYKKRIVIDEKDTKNRKFFRDRVDKIDYEPLKEVLEETKKVLLEEKKLTSFLTQGDPTDTNISCDGIYTDFENAGYNSAIGELAIMYSSFITHGRYFYPKYNSKSYVLRPRITKDYKNITTNKKNIEVMLKFLEVFDDSIDEEIKKYLKYYIIMRMITPIDINMMDKEDQEKIEELVKKIYSMDFTRESFKELIKK